MKYNGEPKRYISFLICIESSICWTYSIYYSSASSPYNLSYYSTIFLNYWEDSRESSISLCFPAAMPKSEVEISHLKLENMLQLDETFWKCNFNYQIRDCSKEPVPKGTFHSSATDDVMKDSWQITSREQFLFFWSWFGHRNAFGESAPCSVQFSLCSHKTKFTLLFWIPKTADQALRVGNNAPFWTLVHRFWEYQEWFGHKLPHTDRCYCLL